MSTVSLFVTRSRAAVWASGVSVRSLLQATQGRLTNGLQKYRVVLGALVYVLCTAAAAYLALWLRFDGAVPAREWNLWLRTAPWLLAISSSVFVLFGLHRAVWRFAGIWDLRDLIGAVTIGWFGFYACVHWWLREIAYPRAVFIIGAVLSVAIVGGLKLLRRISAETHPGEVGKRVLIIGAGSAGEMIVRDLIRKGYKPIGFIDDDPHKLGHSIHRVRVLGGREEIPRIIATESPDAVLIAMPSAGAAAIRRVVGALEPFKVPITTLPPLREIVDGKVTLSQVRKLAIEDLLCRTPVQLDVERARRLIEGKRVLVTGAGGSIGSELCRYIQTLGPERLVLFERYENNLYTVLNTLGEDGCVWPVVGDITDVNRLHAVMREHLPDIVFHAAAHKHVPLMEMNPCEAVKNNVIGTRLVGEAALRFGVERFILISTDKAVNPSSLMGATKRVAELVVQSLAAKGGPLWATVRFGNVLGSNGSVIPRWMEQIAAGGPVTVTHPDVQRYFMLIPEAVQLILQAAAVTTGGEIFALEMGDQVKLIDMARNLITLSGLVPDEDIAIVNVGLRPGEKLYEELIDTDERVESSPADKILRLRPLATPDPAHVLIAVNRLASLAIRGNTQEVIDELCRLVPTFQPGSQLRRESEIRKTSPRTLPKLSRVASAPPAALIPLGLAQIE